MKWFGAVGDFNTPEDMVSWLRERMADDTPTHLPGFQSVTPHQKDDMPNWAPIRTTIQLPAGIPAIYLDDVEWNGSTKERISAAPNERELLLGRGLDGHITDVRLLDDGTVEVVFTVSARNPEKL